MRGMTLAENLKRIRKAADLSQERLAEMAGCSQQLISQIERGINETTKDLPQIAKALGVSVYELDPHFVPGTNPLIQKIVERLPDLGEYDLDEIAVIVERRAARKSHQE